MSRPIDADALIVSLKRKAPISDAMRVMWAECLEEVRHAPTIEPEQRWIRCDQPPQDERNVFLAHGTNDFKSCCIGHYDHSMKKWYEDKNWFASPIYDCKYWCDIPDLPDMGNKQFEMPEPYQEEGEHV